MKRCLWVVPKGVFPVRDGARVANQALLKSIRPFFDEMDVMVFNEENSDELHIESYNADFNPTNVYFLKRSTYSNFLKKLFFLLMSFFKAPELPVTTGYFHTKILRNKVKEVLVSRKFDLIVFDGLHPYTAFMDLNDFHKIKVVYRAHNVEGDLWSTAAAKTKNSIIKKLLLWQGNKMLNLEMHLINRSTRVWNIAEEDLIRYKTLLDGEGHKLDYIPVGLEFKKSQELKTQLHSEKIKLLFLGKMDWAPNKDGLKWFLEDVWPHVNTHQLELQIVGSGDSSWGVDLFKQPGINFIGFAKDLDSIYANCDFSIIPIRYGSGTRIKVIESISKSVPIISTRMGVQGSGLTDFFHADTKEEWIKILSELDRAKGLKMAEAAFYELKKMYSPDLIGEKAYKSIKT